MRKFDIPNKYRSTIISSIKNIRKKSKQNRADLSPTELDFGPLTIYTARHFGFCFGVENAIETVYRIIAEYADKQVYLISEMIHNPKVNQDLADMGVRFIQDTKGNNYIPWSEIQSEDIVIIPAFGTTIEIEELLKKKGVSIEKYDTTCPFVGRVWKRSKILSTKAYTVIIHGKIDHEETRATFSHAAENGHALIIQNMEEAKRLGEVIASERPKEVFQNYFRDAGNRTHGFDPAEHLKKVGVVNQTTMLATETKAIAKYIKEALAQKFIGQDTKTYYADTKDTLCYATSDNQEALYELLKVPADLALVVGGYKSANTTHLVELCESQLSTYFINAADKIEAKDSIVHFDRHTKTEKRSSFIPEKEHLRVLVTSGASCPDAVVEEVIQKILDFFPEKKSVQKVLEEISEISSMP